jgi:hypothetical protein
VLRRSPVVAEPATWTMAAETPTQTGDAGAWHPLGAGGVGAGGTAASGDVEVQIGGLSKNEWTQITGAFDPHQ